MSSQLTNDIKRIVKNTINGMSLCDFEIAKVIEADEGEGPVLQVDNFEPYPKKGIVVPLFFQEFTMEIDGKKTTVKNYLKEDDEVLLMRKPGGQKFIVIGKTYEADEKKQDEGGGEEEKPDENACPYGYECKWCPRNENKEGEEGGEESGGESGSETGGGDSESSGGDSSGGSDNKGEKS